MIPSLSLMVVLMPFILDQNCFKSIKFHNSQFNVKFCQHIFGQSRTTWNCVLSSLSLVLNISDIRLVVLELKFNMLKYLTTLYFIVLFYFRELLMAGPVKPSKGIRQRVKYVSSFLSVYINIYVMTSKQCCYA